MRFDAIIIGTGQAGPPLARLLADEGKKVAIADGGVFGGTCVNYGCTPSKAMIASANAIHTARRGADFGFSAGEVVADFARIIERRDAIVSGSRDGLIKSLEKRENITIYRAYAAFEAPKRLRVGGDLIEGDQIFINTGARAAIPTLPGLDSVPYLDNISLMSLRELPKHLIILGGGYIGMEMAQAFRRYGSDVTVINRSARVLHREDADFSSALLKVLKQEGVRFVLEAAASSVEQKNGKIHLHIQTKDGKAQLISGSHLLVAAGRRPNTDQLGADKAGLELDDKGYIKVDDRLRTNIEGVYALGDVNGKGAFTHTSYNDYEIAAANLKGEDRKVSDRILTYAVFTDPPLARIGMNESEIRARGRKALVASLPMAKVNRAREFGQTNGLLKAWVDAESQQFLGATLFGLNADEILHTFTELMYAQAPATVMSRAVYIHPTVGELLPTLLASLASLE